MKSSWLLTFSAALLLHTGCVSQQSNVVKDSARVKVEFENEIAGRMFYEGMQKGGYTPKDVNSTTKFEVPILFEYRRNVTSGHNAAFNRAVEICDANKDSRITEIEARIFSEHPNP